MAQDNAQMTTVSWQFDWSGVANRVSGRSRSMHDVLVSRVGLTLSMRVRRLIRSMRATDSSVSFDSQVELDV